MGGVIGVGSAWAGAGMRAGFNGATATATGAGFGWAAVTTDRGTIGAAASVTGAGLGGAAATAGRGAIGATGAATRVGLGGATATAGRSTFGAIVAAVVCSGCAAATAGGGVTSLASFAGGPTTLGPRGHVSIERGFASTLCGHGAGECEKMLPSSAADCFCGPAAAADARIGPPIGGKRTTPLATSGGGATGAPVISLVALAVKTPSGSAIGRVRASRTRGASATQPSAGAGHAVRKITEFRSDAANGEDNEPGAAVGRTTRAIR